MNTLAIDLGGTTIKLAVVRDGVIAARSAIPAHSDVGLEAGLVSIKNEADKLVAGYEIAGAGVAFPGIVDTTEKRVLAANGKYSDAVGLNPAGWIQSAFGYQTVLENDANAALMGEISYGIASGCKNAVLIILGTGVGTAAVMDGQLIHGRHYQAGCLGGHFNIPFNQRRCGCGNYGCVEANASSWSLQKLAREDHDYCGSGLSTEKVINFRTLEKWCLHNDRLANRLKDSVVEYWSSCVANMILAYDPETVILSGGIIKFKGLFEEIRDRTIQRTWTPWGTPDFAISAFPENSVLVGLHHIIERERQTCACKNGTAAK